MTRSRFFDATDKVFLNEDGSEKQGQEIIFLDNKVGDDNVTAILNFTDGKLNDNGTIPAIQCDDAHCEFWKNGKLHNTQKDVDGNQMPAIISDYGDIEEYWV